MTIAIYLINQITDILHNLIMSLAELCLVEILNPRGRFAKQ